MTQITVSQCFELIFAGRRSEAREELYKLIKDNPRNDMVWLAMSLCVDQPIQKRDCIQRALFFNPGNSAAQQALQTLTSNPHAGEHENLEESPPSMSKRFRFAVSQFIRNAAALKLPVHLINKPPQKYFLTSLAVTMVVIAIPMAIFMRAQPVQSYPGTNKAIITAGQVDFVERLKQIPQRDVIQNNLQNDVAIVRPANKPAGKQSEPDSANVLVEALAPPQIIAAIPQLSSGEISVHGYLDPSVDLKKFKVMPNVRLYSIQPRGCELAPAPGELLGETKVNPDGSWVINVTPGRSTLVAALMVNESRQSPISNLGLTAPPNNMITLQDAAQLQARAYPLTSEEGAVPLNGKAPPFACVILANQDPAIGEVASAVASEKGEWSLSAPLKDGENHFKLLIKGLENQPGVDVNLKAFQVKLQWPFGEIQNGSFTPWLDRKTYGDVILTAWYGKNDCQWFHDAPLADCYNLKTQEFHNGLDIYADWGTEVRAVADGMIYYIQWDKTIGNGGNAVFIDHGAWSSVYLHLNYITIDPKWVKPYYRRTTRYLTTNQIPVKAGQVIGTVGNSGLKTAPGQSVHLHISAFTWAKGTRDASLAGEYPNAGISTRRMGYTFNLNPPGDAVLQWDQKEIKAAKLFKKCISDKNYWDVNWSKVEIVTSRGGTTFDDLPADEDCSQIN